MRLHVDAAYGGFFALLADGGEPGVRAAPFEAVRARRLGRRRPAQARPAALRLRLRASSPTPRSAGSTLHDSPYTYFTSRELHPGETSLECSRAGAAAAALWATLRALPLTREGLGSHLAGAARAGVAWRSACAGDLRAGGRSGARHRLRLRRLPVARPAISDVDASGRSTRSPESGWHVAKLRAGHRVAAAVAPVGRGGR